MKAHFSYMNEALSKINGCHNIGLVLFLGRHNARTPNVKHCHSLYALSIISFGKTIICSCTHKLFRIWVALVNNAQIGKRGLSEGGRGRKYIHILKGQTFFHTLYVVVLCCVYCFSVYGWLVGWSYEIYLQGAVRMQSKITHNNINRLQK